MYRVLRPLLFSMPPETAHNLSLYSLKAAHAFGVAGLLGSSSNGDVAVQLCGLKFPNPVGLAAGLDKNGDYIDALGSLGFGFIEVGTVTPRPQPGNPTPRLFRLQEREAIINRMGFNNKGVEHLVSRIKRASFSGVLGVNIGKNFDTPNEKAAEDYLFCLKKVYPHADYVAINVSSPNTKGLRELQELDAMKLLLENLMEEKQRLYSDILREVPIFVKISPDLQEDSLGNLASLIRQQGVDGIIATNTTINKAEVSGENYGNEQGGLSGKPLSAKALKVVSTLRETLGSDFPIIGVGGISSAEQAEMMFRAGANLIQTYSGFVYQGPAVISNLMAGFSRTER